MNVELKRIAEKKLEQLGGDVCGVLVRKDGRLAAVDEHGRVQWLQSGQGAEPVGYTNWAQLAHIKTVGEGAVYSDTDHGCDIALYTHPQPAQQGSVPEGWRERVAEMLKDAHCEGQRSATGRNPSPFRW